MGWHKSYNELPLVAISATLVNTHFVRGSPWGLSCHMVWKCFARGYPLRLYLPHWTTKNPEIPPWVIATTLAEKNSRGSPLGPYLPHWLPQNFQGVPPWGCICHIGWHIFFKGSPLGSITATWNDTKIPSGFPFGP